MRLTIDSLRKENFELKSKLSLEESKSKAAKGAYQLINDLKIANESNERLKKQLTEKENEILSMQNNYSQQNSLVSENYKIQEEKINEKIKAYENLIIEINNKHEKLNALNSITQEKLDQKEREYTELKRSFDDIKISNEQLEIKYDKLQKEIKIQDDLKKTLEETKIVNEYYQKLIDEIKNDNETTYAYLKQGLEESKLLNNKYQQDQASFEKQIAELNFSLDLFMKEKEEYEIKLESITEELKNQKELNEKFINERKELISEIEEKNGDILFLQQTNLEQIKELGELKQERFDMLKEINLLKIIIKESQISNQTINTNNRSDDDFQEGEYKEDVKTLYDQTLKKIETLKKDNEKLSLNILLLKEVNQSEIFKLNTTIEELRKKLEESNINTDLSIENSKVSTILKNIQSKVNEAALEESKKEKKEFLEKINKLQLRIEELETQKNDQLNLLNNINFNNDININYSHNNSMINYENSQCEDLEKSLDKVKNNEEVNNHRNGKIQTENIENLATENIENHLDNKNVEQRGNNGNKLKVSSEQNKLMISTSIFENNNEVKERERKIEYLLQILEEKNNLIEQLRETGGDKLNSNNQSFEFKEQFELLQLNNENLLKEIDEKNLKIKKLNKDYNEQVAKYEELYNDYLEHEENTKTVKLFSGEIELLKIKNKEYEQTIEKMKMELNIKASSLIKKETEISTLRADRANANNNRSLADNNTSIYNRSLNDTNNSILKDPKIELLNNSLLELKELKDKLKNNSLNRSRFKRNQSQDSINITNNNSNTSIQLNLNLNDSMMNFANKLTPKRAYFEENSKNKNVADNDKKINDNNLSLNNINNSITENNDNFAFNFNNNNIVVPQIPNEDNKYNTYTLNTSKDSIKITTTSTTAIKTNNNENSNNKQFNENQKNVFSYNNQALFIDNSSNGDKNDLVAKMPQTNIANISIPNNNIANSVINDKYIVIDNTSNNFTSNNSNNGYNQAIFNSNLSIGNSYDNNFNSLNYNSVQNEILKTTTSTDAQEKNTFSPNLSDKRKADNLIQNQDDWDLISDWISSSLNKPRNSYVFKKVFKAKDDGFSSNVFYDKVSGKSPTLTILANNHKKLLGGFTQIPWKTPSFSIDFLEDNTNTGFLFSINLKKKFPLKEQAIAICHNINSGPIFGLNDLEVIDNADKNYNYFSNIGISYNYDGSIEDFYGDLKYLVEDYEVYELLEI